MKKVLLFSTSLFCIFHSNSQVLKKSDKLFGGSFSFSVYDLNPNGTEYYRSSNVGILPSISFVVKDNLAFGVRGNVSYSSNTDGYFNGSEKVKRTNINAGLGLFLKKYKLLQNKFGVYFDHGINGMVTSTKLKTTITSKNNYWGVNYAFSPGVFYKFSDNFLGEANIGGLYASYSYGSNAQNSFGVGASFLQYFNLGINYRILKKVKG